MFSSDRTANRGGSLTVVGLGPGPAAWLTPEAADALARATDLVGYAPYLARVPERTGVVRHPTDNRAELERARHAFALALRGRDVAVVSGGDPGVFAMASAVFEALEAEPAFRRVTIDILPGVTAMQAAAARLGAPLGHDFCALSLSDNLKPWAVVLRRLGAAADGDFVIALYNPASRARPDQLGQAFAHLLARKSGSTPVAFAHAVGRPDERIRLTTLGQADARSADMATLVLIGSSETRYVDGHDGRRWMVTPRTYGAER